jgi:anti-sigma regulatory factor (Ser/Thr protein kinase)
VAQFRRLHLADEHGPGDPAAPNGQPNRQVPSGHRLIVRVLPAGRAARRARAIVRDVLRNADVGEADVTDVELAVGELAANADIHACGPYELRIVVAGEHPVWCEVVDGDQDLAGIPEIFAKLHQGAMPGDCLRAGEAPQESGHGLAIVYRVSGGRCGAFPTVTCATGQPGKAVAFALPGLSDRSRSDDP